MIINYNDYNNNNHDNNNDTDNDITLHIIIFFFLHKMMHGRIKQSIKITKTTPTIIIV